MKKLLVLISTCFISINALALDMDAQLEKAIESFKIATKYNIKGASRTPTPGLFVVLTEVGPLLINYDGKLMLTNDKGFHSEVKGTIKGKDFDRIRYEAMSELNPDSIIVIRHGTGEENVILYSALDCQYCLKQEIELSEKALNATIYIVPTVLDRSNWSKLNKIMCSEDRAAAWSDYMLNKELPENDGQCYWSDNYSYMGTERYRTVILKAQGTPQMIYADGIVKSPRPNMPLGNNSLTVEGGVDIFNPSSITTAYFSKDVYTPPKKSMFGGLFKK
jgi:thiol:disulfide interchange protein DsbC